MQRAVNFRKIPAILFAVLLSLALFCGCDITPDYTKAEIPTECRFEYSVNETVFSGRMKISSEETRDKEKAEQAGKNEKTSNSETSEKNAEFTFDSPESLNGAVIKIRDGESQLTLINQTFTANCDRLPYEFVPARLCDLFFADISLLTAKNDSDQSLVYSVFSIDKAAELVFEKETGALCEVRLENTVVKITDNLINETDKAE